MAISADTVSTLVTHLGESRWVRGHISAFCVGAVMLVSANLLIGGSRLWSLTAIGIWIMLLVVHIIVVVIARLSHVLLADDEEEIALLPIKDAFIIQPQRDPTSTWVAASPPPINNQRMATSATAPQETVSWTVATDAAQVKRRTDEDASP